MHKGENTLLIWVLSWAGVLLALLYSPLGSPDLYSSKNYFSDNQGVNFNKVTIFNAPGASNDGNNNDFSIPVTRDVLKKNLNYAVNAIASPTSRISRGVTTTSSRAYDRNSSAKIGTESSGNYSISSVASGATKANKTKSNASTGSIGIGGEMSGLLAFNSSTGGSGVAQDSTVMQDTYTTTPRQKADEPGVPVGDGWKILAVLVGIYGLFKAKKSGLLVFKKNYSSQILSKE